MRRKKYTWSLPVFLGAKQSPPSASVFFCSAEPSRPFRWYLSGLTYMLDLPPHPGCQICQCQIKSLGNSGFPIKPPQQNMFLISVDPVIKPRYPWTDTSWERTPHRLQGRWTWLAITNLFHPSPGADPSQFQWHRPALLGAWKTSMHRARRNWCLGA